MDAATAKTLKVAELKDELSSRGLETKGKKAVLQKRLLEALEAEAEPVPAAAEPMAEDPAPEPVAEPEPEPLPEPVVAPEPVAEPVPEPVSVPVPVPEPVVAAEPEPQAAAVVEAPVATEPPAAADSMQVDDAPAPAEPSVTTTLPTQPDVPAAADTADTKKGKKKKKKKKKKKYNEPVRETEEEPVVAVASGGQDVEDPKNQVTIEYVAEEVDFTTSDPTLADFQAIFERFKVEERVDEAEEEEDDETNADKPKDPEDKMDDDDSGDEKEDKESMSKTKLRKMNRLTVAELKQLVDKPDVIEVHDVTAADPRLLVHLKATRNTVPVPKHWSQKRKYLQNKRGIEKPPFELPDYIIKTGIQEMREALQEKEERMGLKGKQREKSRPKMGKIDIDYQKLHDAFFRWQTKPKMSLHGDMYYEGKEFETKVVDRKPGNLSDDLKLALGMPVGEEEEANPIPPPWLLHMQRYGPPPSYPNLKIPGLNAPIPEGASFGYSAGQWGKPPVDEFGHPLYGDVFGSSSAELEAREADENVSRELWGQLESEDSEESSDEDESEEGSDAEEGDEKGTETPSGYTSETPSGATSVATGAETPESALELRKRRIEDDMENTGEQQALYKVVPQKQAVGMDGMMASTHVYDVAAASAGVDIAAGVGAAKKGKKTDGDGFEIAVENPEDIANMDQDALKQKYDAAEAAKSGKKDDFSDMVAEHTNKANKKRKANKSKDDKQNKKFKNVF